MKSLLGLWIVCLVITPFSLSGKNAVKTSKRSAQESPLAAPQLQEKFKYYRSLKRLDSSFEQTKTLSDMGIDISSQGTFTLIPPDKVIWKVTKPSLMTLTLDKDSLTMKGEGETLVLKQDGPSKKVSDSIQKIVSWLKMDVKQLVKDYQVFEVAKQRYRFVPLDKDSPFKGMEMDLALNGHLEKLRLQEKSGDEIEIKFSSPRVVRKK